MISEFYLLFHYNQKSFFIWGRVLYKSCP